MEKLIDAIRAVRAIHAPSRGIAGTFCSHCNDGNRDKLRYPCPTIQAIDEALDGGNEEHVPMNKTERCMRSISPTDRTRCGYFLVEGLCVRHGRQW
jgi:hypothetical protein